MPGNSALWQSEIGLTRLPEDDELYILWSQFWGKASAYDSDGDGVGNGIKVLSLSAPLPGPSRIRKVLMRDEYLRCLKDAERFFRTPKPEPFLTEEEEEDKEDQGIEDESSDVGTSLNENNIEKVDSDDGNVQERLAKGLPEENVDVGEISGNRQRVEDVGSLTAEVGGSEKVDVTKDPMMNAAAFVVIGHPGIGAFFKASSQTDRTYAYYSGKTIGLWIALLYCFTRCRPVVFQYELKDIFFFSADGAFKTIVTPTPRVWNRYIPDSTWCLVDTNPHFGFEQSITTIGRCILQTCSPRKERISWMSKHEGVRMIWIMKPMLLSEEQTWCALGKVVLISII
ncbi:hypothetical protein VKT23_007287 [Stygiomarasmius scandens]|uniref:Uncharacterized protein n=1 Tax=Marasmiellus scandens TaxID=2682957 RepID=A0ABR1JJD2_9AGAR